MKINHLLVAAFVLLPLIASGCKEPTKSEAVLEEAIVKPYMELPDTVLLLGEWLEGTIHNQTNVSLIFGEKYRLSYKEGGEWKHAMPNDDNIGFNSLAYGLPANGENQFRIYLYKDLYDYKEGQYKLDKELMLTITAEFYVVKEVMPEQQTSTKERMEGLNFDLYLEQDTILEEAGAIRLWFRNNSDVYVYPLDHYFMERYLEEEERWLSVDMSNYTGNHEMEVAPNSTVSFDIATKVLKMKEGRYRIRKDIEIPVSTEFVLTY